MAKKTTNSTGKATGKTAVKSTTKVTEAKAKPEDAAKGTADTKPEVAANEAAKTSDAVEDSVTETPEATAAGPEDASGQAKDTGNEKPAVEDAEILDETPASGEGQDFVMVDTPEDADEAKDEETAADESSEEDHTAVATTPPPDAAAPPPEPVVIRKGGFVPLVLGGVVAAGIGFAAARYVLPEGWPWPGADNGFEAQVSEQLKTQGDEIAAIRDELGKAPDMSAAVAPIEQRLGEISGQVDDLGKQYAAQQERMDGVEARLNKLAQAPVTGAADPAAVAAYEKELKALQDAMAKQRGEIEDMLKQAQEKDAAAQAAATLGKQRAALAGIRGALESGAPYSDAINALKDTGADVPAGLSQSADTGVPSQTQLASEFPAAARAALAAARQGESGGGFAAFLDRQLGARSLEPIEGDSPDAVLSRAEAAVREGRLGDALDLVAALPQPAQDAMQDWIARAKTRLAALNGAQELTAKFNAN